MKQRFILRLIVPLVLIFEASSSAYAQVWESISTHDTLVQLILTANKDTFRIGEMLEVKVEILNAGKESLYVLSRFVKRSQLGNDLENYDVQVTGEKGKPINFFKVFKHDSIMGDLYAMEPSPSTLLLRKGEFWGTTFFWDTRRFSKPGIYFFQFTYYGCSPEFIQDLILYRILKPSDLRVPPKKIWHTKV